MSNPTDITKEEEASRSGNPNSTIISEAIETEPHSVFTARQKSWIIFIAALAGWFSTASSFIYFPAIPFLATDMRITIEQVNLTVTFYLVASAISPAITGSFADKYGRRTSFLCSIGAYALVNIGLAVQRHLGALFVLRMLQSISISGTFAIAYGVIGDLTTPADRGGYTGIISVFLTTPPSIAPLISGLLLIQWKWPAIFWFLVVASTVVFLCIISLLPETCRAIAGSGSRSRELSAPINRPTFLALCPPTTSPLQIHAGEQDTQDATPRATGPIATLALLKQPNNFLATLLFGIYYALWSCLQASLSTVFVKVYNVSGLVSGLSYIPFGTACSIASYMAGRVIDRDYQIIASVGHISPSPGRDNNDLHSFPIESARFRTIKYFLIVCGPLIAAYGWSLQVKAHISVPLVLQFLIGFTNQPLFTALNTILVDLNPGNPASVQAASNVIRCFLAAILLAVIDIQLRGIGPGWTFTIYGAIHASTLVLVLAMIKMGPKWRLHEDG